MKTMLQMTVYLSIALLLSTSMMFGDSGRVSDESRRKERPEKSGWIGIMIQDVNKKIARKAKLDSEEVAYVQEVIEDSPAESAGIQEGDVIVEFNGRKIFDSDDIVRTVRKTTNGMKVDLIIIRDGEKKTMNLTIGMMKEKKHKAFGMMPDVNVLIGNNILGLKLLTLNEQLGEYFSAPNKEGVLVQEVEKDGAGEKAGFRAGDVIIRVGEKTVSEIKKLRKQLEKYDEGDTVEIEVLRKGVKKNLFVEIEEKPVLRKKFFFRHPHFQMFQSDPFDDTEMYFEMDELQPRLDRLQIEIEQATRNLENKQWEMLDRTRKLKTPSFEAARL